ncbi:MAG: class II aldolase/adducin family protein [Chloroflexota bacterium]
MDERAAAAQIVAAGRRLGARGLISAGEGNLSIRLDGDRVAITPRGRRKDELVDRDLVVMAIGHPRAAASSASGLEPSSDLAIHLAALAARRDVAAVAHAHLPAAMALTLAGEVPDPAALPETALFIPRLPYLPFGEPGSDDLAARIAEALTAEPAPHADAVLLERHGAVAVGPDLATAIDRLELVEVLCRTWRDSLLIRAARTTLDQRPSDRQGAGPTG